MATRYWVGGSGTWATSTTRWSTTSGGAGGASVPTSADDVIFDANSGTGTVTVSNSSGLTLIPCKSLTTTGSSAFTFQTSFANMVVECSGNFTIDSNITWGTANPIAVRINASGTITTNGATIVGDVICSASSPSVINLGSDLTLGGTTRDLETTGTGTFDTQNYNVTVTGTLNFSAGTINLGSSTLKSTRISSGSFCSVDPSVTMNAGTSTIVADLGSNTPTGSGSFTFSGSTKTYYNVGLTGSTAASSYCYLNIGTGSTFNTIFFTKPASTTANRSGISLPTGGTINVENINITGGSASARHTIAGGHLSSAFSTYWQTALFSTVNFTTDNPVSLDYVQIYNALFVPNNTYKQIMFNVTNSGMSEQSIAAAIGVVYGSLSTAKEYYLLTDGTSWTVPPSWVSANNTIHLFGGGGGGSQGVFGTRSGAGGGGGGYTKVTNLALTPGASVSYAIGAAGLAPGNTGGTGGTTSFSSGTYTAGGGTGANTTTGGTGGTGSTFNGGNGGNGVSGANIGGGAGGGGAGGPLGNGANGGNGTNTSTTANRGSGGGGGNGGGTAGASGLNGGAGGNNFFGVGGGAGYNFNGTDGGGARGNEAADYSTLRASVGGAGRDLLITGLLLGGGGGNSGSISNGTTPEIASNSAGNYNLFGGGGSGGSPGTSSGFTYGTSGAQGAIIIVNVVATPSGSSSNFFLI